MNRLEADLSVPVIYAGSDVPGEKYVGVQQPNSTPRRTFTSRGQEVVLSCRCHVHAPKGKVPPLEAQNLASQVEAGYTGTLTWPDGSTEPVRVASIRRMDSRLVLQRVE